MAPEETRRGRGDDYRASVELAILEVATLRYRPTERAEVRRRYDPIRPLVRHLLPDVAVLVIHAHAPLLRPFLSLDGSVHDARYCLRLSSEVGCQAGDANHLRPVLV